MTLFGGLTILCLSTQLVIAEDVESPKDDIAAEIRAQGYACDQPRSVTRDAQAAGLLEPNWLPTPDGQSYNLTYRFYGPSQDIVSGEWLPPPLTEQK